MAAFCAVISFSLLFWLTILRRRSPYSRNLLFTMRSICAVLSEEKVSGATHCGTSPYLSTRSMTPQKVPPSLTGYLKKNCTSGSPIGFLPVSMTPCSMRFAFSSWSQKNRWLCENSTTLPSLAAAKSARSTFIPENIQHLPELFWLCMLCFGVSIENVCGTGNLCASPMVSSSMPLFLTAFCSAFCACVFSGCAVINSSMSAVMPPLRVCAPAAMAVLRAKTSISVFFVIAVCIRVYTANDRPLAPFFRYAVARHLLSDC